LFFPARIKSLRGGVNHPQLSPNSGFPFSFRSTIRDCVSVCFSFIPFSCTKFSSESRRLYSHLQSSSWRFSIFSVFFDGYRRNL